MSQLYLKLKSTARVKHLTFTKSHGNGIENAIDHVFKIFFQLVWDNGSVTV